MTNKHREELHKEVLRHKQDWQASRQWFTGFLAASAAVKGSWSLQRLGKGLRKPVMDHRELPSHGPESDISLTYTNQIWNLKVSSTEGQVSSNNLHTQLKITHKNSQKEYICLTRHNNTSSQ